MIKKLIDKHNKKKARKAYELKALKLAYFRKLRKTAYIEIF